jgi:hypothetical protein
MVSNETKIGRERDVTQFKVFSHFRSIYLEQWFLTFTAASPLWFSEFGSLPPIIELGQFLNLNIFLCIKIVFKTDIINSLKSSGYYTYRSL